MGEYLPSNEGVTIPATFEVMTNLINGVIDLAADNEGKQLLEEALKMSIIKFLDKASEEYYNGNELISDEY